MSPGLSYLPVRTRLQPVFQPSGNRSICVFSSGLERDFSHVFSIQQGKAYTIRENSFPRERMSQEGQVRSRQYPPGRPPSFPEAQGSGARRLECLLLTRSDQVATHKQRKSVIKRIDRTWPQSQGGERGPECGYKIRKLLLRKRWGQGQSCVRGARTTVSWREQMPLGHRKQPR